MGIVEIIVGLLGGGGIALVAAVLLFFFARRAMKFVVRVAIFVVIVVALVIGVSVYWYSSSGKSTRNVPSNRPANSRPRQPN
jgi:energy-coupling factor transporter transmembrane protein EcfT